MKKKRELVHEGQEIFVTDLGGFYSRPKPNLKKWTVVKVNKSSFYANPEGVEDKSPYRFSQKDLSCSTGWGNDYQAYRNEQEYWDMIERTKERSELRKELKDKIEKMTLSQLRELKEKIV